MRKIDPQFENPVDNILIDIADKASSAFKSANFTPNYLTTISLFLGLMSAYYLYIRNNKMATILFILAYYFDVMDGHFARKYNMVSEFGDYYDHFSDWIKYLAILYAMYKVDSNKIYYVVIVIGILFMLQNIHLGCQEKMYESSVDQPLLQYTKMLCPDPSYIQYTRYFGCGTLAFIMAILIYFY